MSRLEAAVAVDGEVAVEGEVVVEGDVVVEGGSGGEVVVASHFAALDGFAM